MWWLWLRPGPDSGYTDIAGPGESTWHRFELVTLADTGSHLSTRSHGHRLRGRDDEVVQ